ncbi:adenylyl-sulfate kinase [Pseudoduganella rhizocola]|uniref:adenylyl-sulfate kinase n=1 Tax=Pseudoduganella rhizocola TaxID=3382643 RepID=UPI0038B4E5A5
MITKSRNIVWHDATITRRHREELNGHQSKLIWFTGLSGSGKSTLAHAIEERLHRMGCRTFVLDGDNVRHGLCADLGFSDDARAENIRRVGETAKLFVDAGILVLTAFISPFEADRARVRALLGQGDFVEVYCHCSLSTCEKRDVKGLYKRARAGEIQDFTGISSPYEVPAAPDLKIDTESISVEDSVDLVLSLLHARGVFAGR